MVDIDPPTKLSNLKGNQEIKIGLHLTDDNKFDSANYPECYWYDSASKSKFLFFEKPIIIKKVVIQDS